MLKDGSFIKQYCRLLVNEEPDREHEIRQYFYEHYKDRVTEKFRYFEQYFKENIKIEKEETLSRSRSQRKRIQKF